MVLSSRTRIPLFIGLASLVFGLLNASRLRILLPKYDPGFGWKKALLWGMPDAVIWALLSAVPILLARRFPVGRDLRNWGVHLFGATVVVGAHSFLDAASTQALGDYSTVSLLDAARDRWVEAFHANVLVYALIVGVAQYLASSGALQAAERRASRLDVQLAEAKLQALRAQIRPHFLMNALNTVAGLVESDPESARAQLRRIGELMRVVLRTEGESEIPLRDELAFTRDYLEIEHARFRDRLRIRFEVGPGVEGCLVPPFLLQPLAENAVLHGVGVKEEGGEVVVRAALDEAGLRLEVEDDGVGMAVNGAPGSSRIGGGADPGTGPQTMRDVGSDAEARGGTGIGLRNLRGRLRNLYGSDHEFTLAGRESGGTRVTVRIPARRLTDRTAVPVGGVDR